jgi:hypothetical protein
MQPSKRFSATFMAKDDIYNNMNSTLTRYAILLLPLVFLMMVSVVTNSTQAWGENWYGHWGYGYNSWYYQARQDGYQQGYSDGSNNDQYNCSGHTSIYCASYGHGYANGQAQFNQDNQQPAQNQRQQQYISSTSYSQSNPNIKVVINNVIPNSNNSTAGAAQNSGTSEKN